MQDILERCYEVNNAIRESEDYRRYIAAKERLHEHPELVRTLQEFSRKNHEILNATAYNPYDEQHAIVREYDDLLHNSIVNEFIRSEQRLCKIMQQVIKTIADGLEFVYSDG